MKQSTRRVIVALLSLALVGCTTTVPYTGAGPHPQIERGAPFPPVDILGNILSLPFKLLLWNWDFNVHSVSAETEDSLVDYLEARDLIALNEAKFRLNQYRPLQDLSRLVKNRHAAWPYRLLIGLPTTLIGDVLLPGRLFPWGDYYNPFTNTVHLYSDDAAITLHEAGHVYDFGRRRWKGTYATMRLIPFFDLYQEYKATGEAMTYLREVEDRPAELEAYKTLHPAYGSYVGSYLFPPIGTVVGILVGHITGRTKAALKRRHYERTEEESDQVSSTVEPTDTTGELAPAADSP